MMRKFLCAVLLLALSACASLAASLDDLKYLNGELRVGMECAYAPNNWQEAVKSDTNIAIANVPGAYAEGYDVQFAAIIAKHLNLKPIIIKMDWDGLIEALNQGQIDVIIAGMMDTAERRQAINFSKPYHSTIYSMMLNKGSKFENATSIQDFKGASVLGQKDTALDTVIDQIEGVNHLAAVASVPDMIARLREGACDAIVINLENSKGYLASNPDFRLVVFEEGKGFKLPAVGSCVGIRKSDNALLELVDEALATVEQDAREVMWETAVNKQPK
ncbi:MAG: transporter substrate-binding domain-containing protein [Synergistaceae bacterium]|nr:transporter substrate-binding domain-containing protein [Synergistaceae bacterium]